MNMVRAGVVTHPGEWPDSGYREIQHPPKRYRIIDLPALVSLLGMDSLRSLQRAHADWVDEAVRTGRLAREPLWTEALAVGSERFVANVQARLGVSARYREVVTDGRGGHAIREAGCPYGLDFERKNGLLGENLFGTAEKMLNTRRVALVRPIEWMTRVNCCFLAGHVWHITHRCHEREFLLKFARDRRRWLHWLFEARKRFGLCVLNYLVTSNHVHLLVQDRGDGEISRSMQLIAGRMAREYNLSDYALPWFRQLNHLHGPTMYQMHQLGRYSKLRLTLFRPPVFAAYSARSDAATNSSAVAALSGNVVTPMLTVTPMAASGAILILLVATELRIRSATTAASLLPVSGSMTKNSSPP
jgi:REP element-mobilizing transposase RayT